MVRGMRIVSKVVLLVSLSVAAVIGGLHYASVHQTEKMFHEEIDRLLTSNLEFAGKTIFTAARNVTDTAANIARDPHIFKALFLQVSTGINQHLNSTVSIYSQFKHVMIVEPNGDVFAINTQDNYGRKIAGEEVLGLNVRENPRFAEPAGTWTTVGAPGPDPYLELLGVRGGMSQWFITPVVKGDKLMGWVVVSYDWEAEMSRLLVDFTRHLADLGHHVLQAALTDENGHHVVGTDSSHAKFVPNQDVLWREKQILFGPRSLSLVIAYDRTRTNRPIKKVKIFFLVLGGAGAALLAGILYFVLRGTLLAKIHAIGAATRAFREGNLTYRLPDFGRDELGELGETFNEMGSSLQGVLRALRLETEALRNSEARFRAFMDNSPGMAFIKDPHGFILYFNQTAERFFNCTQTDWSGKRDSELFPEEVVRQFRATDEIVLTENRAMVAVHGMSDPQGHLHYWLTTRFPLEEPATGRCIGGIALDITERREAEEAQALLATAVEQATESIVISDRRGTVQYVNPAFEKISGYSRNEVLGRDAGVWASGEAGNTSGSKLWDALLREGTWKGRFSSKRKDGTLYHEDATVSPVRNAAGEIVSYVAVKRDISGEMALQGQLFQAQKMEAVGTLAGGVAHDFNNILTVVLGFSELLMMKKEKEDPDYPDLQEIAQAARNGADLVKRLLAFSRKAESKPRPMNLNHQVEQLQKVLSRTLPKMIGIELKLTNDLRKINADPTQMDQILMNLAVNARDAMREKGKLTIETANVTLDEEYCKLQMGTKPGEYVLLSVSDDGHGMDKETLKHIFEPFFTTKAHREGTGLGLAMVYGIVQQHGGCIMCHSEPSKGTTFKMYFPAVVSEEQFQEAESRTPPLGGFETILIVDDEQPVRDLGVRILTNAGYKVITASNGKEALEMYQAQSSEISLVLLDLVMPEMGGKQCLESLLSCDPAAKVVIATGYTSPGGTTREKLASTARGFIEKPYDGRQVLDVVRSVLDK